jgi:hypothetical protein
MEVILRQESAVKDHPSKTPPSVGLKAGAFADIGTLILTNRRLVYINKGGGATALAWGAGGALMAMAVESSVSKAQLDEVSTQPGSYSTPLENITRVEAGKKMGQSFVTVEMVGGAKPVHCYVVQGGVVNQGWVDDINKAKNMPRYGAVPQNMAYTAAQGQPAAYAAPQPQAYMQPQQQSAPVQKRCQRCGALDSGSKFCTSCGAPLAQTQQPQQTYQAPPPPLPQQQTPTCPGCGSPIRYIAQYQRWWCDKERRYL